jgi:hypothetical protein
VEGVVIVGSILLAFGIDAWWEERQERAEETALLLALRAEVTRNLDSLSVWEDTLRITRDRAKELHQLSGPNAERIEPDRLHTLLVAAVSSRTFHPSTGAVGAARERLSLLSSEELRQEIAAFDERLRDLQENFDWSIDEAGEVLSSVQDEVPLYTSNNFVWTQGAPDLDTRSILRDLRFANLLGLWIWRVEKMMTEASNLREHLTRMLALTGSY